MNDKKVVIMGLLILVVAMFLTNSGSRPSGFASQESVSEVSVVGPTQKSVVNRGELITVSVKVGSAGVKNHGVDSRGVGIRCQNRRVQGTAVSLCGSQSTCTPNTVYVKSYRINNDEDRWPSGNCYAYVMDKSTGEERGYFTVR